MVGVILEHVRCIGCLQKEQYIKIWFLRPGAWHTPQMRPMGRGGEASGPGLLSISPHASRSKTRAEEREYEQVRRVRRWSRREAYRAIELRLSLRGSSLRDGIICIWPLFLVPRRCAKYNLRLAAWLPYKSYSLKPHKTIQIGIRECDARSVGSGAYWYIYT